MKSWVMVYLTRIERFNAAHKLWVDTWSDEENESFFGKCSNKNWHGHNYKLHVTIKGEPHPITGFIMDSKDLSKLIKGVIIERVDHKNLNLDVPFIGQGVQPTSENLVKIFWELLEDALTDVELHSVKLYETENFYAEYLG